MNNADALISSPSPLQAVSAQGPDRLSKLVLVLLALVGAAGVGYIAGYAIAPRFPSHEYQLRRLAVGERFIHLRNTPTPDGVDEEAWRQMTGSVTSAFAHATYTQSRSDLESLNRLGRKWSSLNWDAEPPNVSDLRRVLQDMADVVGPEDETFASILERFEAARGLSSGQ